MRYLIVFSLFIFHFSLFIFNSSVLRAQEPAQAVDATSIVTNSFWDNWYGQLGGDMTLLFPVGHDAKDVFPNGKGLGLSLAVGKWFSPEFGGKFKLNWNNGIIRQMHNVWYNPYGVPGGSHNHGGFILFSGDIELNVHNLFCAYRPDRTWNLIVSPRAGGWINVKEFKGAPILGVGLHNTYRLSDKWQLFGDVNYNFVPSLNGIASGTDHGGNSFAEIIVGAEMALSRHRTFHQLSDQEALYEKGAVLNSFWDNWFVQAGIDMTLQTPYGTNFANVFPNGHSFGINLGLGKWFTPEIGVRGGFNWQNSIIINHHAYWLAPIDDPHFKLDKRGFFGLYGDLFFNLHNIIGGYDESRRWNAIFFPRMGLTTNFSSSYAECPMIGFGTEQTYVLSDRVKLFADIAFQAMTSGFHDKFKTPSHGLSCNGYIDINIGVQLDLGKNCWRKAK